MAAVNDLEDRRDLEGLSQRLDYKLIIHYALIGLGKLAADAGQLSRSARLWGAADALVEAYGAHLTKGGRALLDYEAQGRDKPLLVVIDGRDKPFRVTLSEADYSAVRQLGEEYRRRNPRSLA